MLRAAPPPQHQHQHLQAAAAAAEAAGQQQAQLSPFVARARAVREKAQAALLVTGEAGETLLLLGAEYTSTCSLPPLQCLGVPREHWV